MITPIVTSLSREVIATVPQIDREAHTRWAPPGGRDRGAVWPHSRAASSERCCSAWAGRWARQSP